MLALSVAGLVAVAFAIMYITEVIKLAKLQGNAFPSENFGVFLAPALVIVVGLSLPTLWLVSRGVDRFEEVSRLRNRLARQAGPEGTQPKRFEVSVTDYDRVARIEKKQVLDDRHRSVRVAAKLASSSIYAVQRSYEAQAAIERLDAAARLQLEEAIYGLMAKPKPKTVREDPSGRLSLPVSGSQLVLDYVASLPRLGRSPHPRRESHRTQGMYCVGSISMI